MDSNVVTKSVKTSLQNLCSNNWEKDRKEIIHGKSSSKLELYASIKSKYGFKQYLTDVTNFKKRKNITQLRISAQKFPVKTGRYKKISREQRK